nr:MAG TPA: hypothetical protein [Caudoviricetes sp.]
MTVVPLQQRNAPNPDTLTQRKGVDGRGTSTEGRREPNESLMQPV